MRNSNNRDLIIINAIALVALVLIVLMLHSNVLPLAISLICWLIMAIVFNYKLIFGGKKNKIVDKKKLFSREIESFNRAEESLKLRENVFRRLPEDDRLRETYELICKQVYSNIKSATAFIESYDYINRQSTEYLKKLCIENDHLLAQLSELVEYQIKIESTVDDVDTDRIDSMLEALKSTVDYK